MKIKQNFGFTLLEVVITTAVVAILVGLAFPSYERIIQNSRLENAARNIYSIFNAARQEALTSGQLGFVCRSTNNPINPDNPLCLFGSPADWNFGLISYRTLPGMIVSAPNASFGNQRFNSGNFGTATSADERQQMLIRISDFQDNEINFVSNSDDRVVVFNANGTLRNDAPFRIAVCDSRGEDAGMYIEVNAVGRVFLRNIEGAAFTCANPA